MDDAGLPSLFVVVYYYRMDPPYFSILQLDTPGLQLDTPRVIKKTKVVEKEYIIRFNEDPMDGPTRREPINGPTRNWLFSSLTSSTGDLYMVPYGGCQQLRGFKFNFTTERFLPIKPPKPSKMHGHVVNLKGRIYFIGYDWYWHDKHNVFQCYDPDENSWKSLEPFPNLARLGPIVATAVWGDTILFNVDHRNIWAYDVSESRWCLVLVEDEQCYYIVGETFVVNGTIYALANEPFNLVVALSIQKNRIDGDLVFKCSLLSEIRVRGMKPINYQDLEACKPTTWLRTGHLVHLGKDNFCLVQCCELVFGFSGYQNIQLTYIKLEGKNPWVVADFVHKAKLPSPGQFRVKLCFSLPKCKTAVLKEGKIFNLDLYREDYEEEIVTLHKDGLHATSEPDNDSSQTNILDEQVDCNWTQALGSSSFGPIETDWIQVKSNKEELEQSWASELKALKDDGGGTESQPIGDPSEAESSKNEEVDKLITQVMSLKSEAVLLRCALENQTQVEMQRKSTYDMVEQSKSSFSGREAELEPVIQQSRLQIEQLKANLMDKETKSQGIWEKKEELNVELASKGEPDNEKDKLKADLLNKETDLRRVKKELKLWRTSKAAADKLLSTGNNGKSMDRSVSMGSKYSPRSRGNMLRRILKKGIMI